MSVTFKEFKVRCIERYRDDFVYQDLAERLERFVSAGPVAMQRLLVQMYLEPTMNKFVREETFDLCYLLGKRIAKEIPVSESIEEAIAILGGFIGDDIREIAANKLVYPIVSSLRECQVILPPGMTAHEQVNFLKLWYTPGQATDEVLNLFGPLGRELSGKSAVLDLFRDGSLLHALRMGGDSSAI